MLIASERFLGPCNSTSIAMLAQWGLANIRLFSCAEAAGPQAPTIGEEGDIQEVPVLMEDVEEEVHMSELNA